MAVAAVLLLTGLAVAQTSAPASFPHEVTLIDSAAQATLECRLLCNIVFVPGRLNGLDSCWFILDSGSPHSALNRDRPLPGMSAPDGRAVDTAIHNVEIELNGVLVKADSLHLQSLGYLEPLVGHRIDGIIGCAFFDATVVTVDYVGDSLTVRLTDSAPFVGEGDVLEVVVEGGEPRITVAVQRPDSTWCNATLRLATGCNEFAVFNHSFLESERLITDSQPAARAVGPVIGCEPAEWATRLAGIRFGAAELNRPVIGHTRRMKSPGAVGTLGGECLRRFTVTFDLSHGRIILTPNDRFRHPLTYDMSGMAIVAEGSDLRLMRVAGVLPGSAAERAGVLAGDYVGRVEGSPAMRVMLSDLRRRLTIPRTLGLVMQRGGSAKKVLLDLRPVI
jgi:hypothetical protein